MPGHEDVVVAGIMQARIAFRVVVHADFASGPFFTAARYSGG